MTSTVSVSLSELRELISNKFKINQKKKPLRLLLKTDNKSTESLLLFGNTITGWAKLAKDQKTNKIIAKDFEICEFPIFMLDHLKFIEINKMKLDITTFR